MYRYRLVATLSLLAAIVGVPAGSGPPSSASRQVPAPPVFSTSTELVVLQVMVKDRRGSYIPDLKPDAFSVFEDERRQTIAFFSDQDGPVTVGLLVDSSGSMRPERDLVIAAAGSFVETSNPADEIFALAFGDDVRAVLPPTAPFTGDADVLRHALTRTVSSMGRTALHDAIAAGLDYLARGRHPRKALVVVSDGGDNASRATFEQVVRKTQVSNTVIYTVALADPIERDANPRRLGQLAAASGGEAFRPRGVARIADALRDIARDIRHTYTIGYVSSNPARQGRFLGVGVIVRSPDHRRVLVRTRQGYFVEE